MSVRGLDTARSNVSTMSESRRRKLEALRNKALGPRSSKREKLKTVLKKKLVAKYGNKWMDVIAEEVDRFITATMDKKLVEKDLAQLENKISRSCILLAVYSVLRTGFFEFENFHKMHLHLF